MTIRITVGKLSRYSYNDYDEDAEDETKKKQEKVNEIKTLIEHKADLMTKNAQKIENLDDLWKYKKFLDKITPKDFQDQVERRKIEKISTRKEKQKTEVKDSGSGYDI